MKYAIIASMLLISGCAHLSQTKTEKLAEGTHSLSTIGNVFASKDELQQKLNERAARICGGSENFEYIGEVEVKPFSQETNSSGVSTKGSYQVFSRLVRCTN